MLTAAVMIAACGGRDCVRGAHTRRRPYIHMHAQPHHGTISMVPVAVICGSRDGGACRLFLRSFLPFWYRVGVQALRQI